MTQILFLGAGNMASAMVGGLLSQGRLTAPQIACVGGAGDTTGQDLAARTGVRLVQGPADCPDTVDAVVLAVKPQTLAQLDPAWQTRLHGRLFISILAGKPLRALRAAFPGARAIVRSMPNTPGRIGAGITAWCAEGALSERDAATVRQVLGSLGKLVPLPEDQLDAVTAVSGSGPAYLFEFVAALREAARAAGLPEDAAQALADETVIGSARLLESTREDPEALRRQVTSPGGTTAAGLRVLEERGFRDLLREVVAAAKARSIELAR